MMHLHRHDSAKRFLMPYVGKNMCLMKDSMRRYPMWCFLFQ